MQDALIKQGQLQNLNLTKSNTEVARFVEKFSSTFTSTLRAVKRHTPLLQLMNRPSEAQNVYLFQQMFKEEGAFTFKILGRHVFSTANSLQAQVVKNVEVDTLGSLPRTVIIIGENADCRKITEHSRVLDLEK